MYRCAIIHYYRKVGGAAIDKFTSSKRILASLKQKGLIRHEGSNKNGKWRVNTRE